MRAGAGWLISFIGGLGVVLSASNLDTANQCTPEPQQMTLRELLDGKAGKNRYVTVTDFKLCGQYVTRKFKHEQKYWVSYIGVVPPGTTGAPGLIIDPQYANEEHYLVDKWSHEPSLTGILMKPDREPDWEQKRMAETYPGLDLLTCMILCEGRKPVPPQESWNSLWKAVGLLAVGVILLSPGLISRVRTRFQGRRTTGPA